AHQVAVSGGRLPRTRDDRRRFPGHRDDAPSLSSPGSPGGLPAPPPSGLAPPGSSYTQSMADPPSGAPAESVHSPAMAAHISHAVIATYAAAAARSVAGVDEICDAHPVRPERTPEPDRAPRGVRVQSDGGRLAVELHLVAGWGVSLPGMAAAVQAAVREHLA